MKIIFSWENGENHLLFNMVSQKNEVSLLSTDRAMIAGADFNIWSFRTGFDFSIPFLGYLRDESNKIGENVARFVLIAFLSSLSD